MTLWELELARMEMLEPEADGLTEPELRQAAGRQMTPRREAEWRAGRALLRRLLHRRTGQSPTDLAVVNRPDGAPVALIRTEEDWAPAEWSVTLSHRDGVAAGLIWRDPHLRVGIDLERVEPRSPAFLEDFLLPAERDWVERANDRDRAAATIWSLKEAGLKALTVGLAVDTHRLRAEPMDVGWALRPDETLGGEAAALEAVAVQREGWVATLAAGGPGCKRILDALARELEKALTATLSG